MTKRVHIIAAHSDDEVLGCGGTVAELSNIGYEFYATILGTPESGKYPLNPTKEEREEISKKRLATELNVTQATSLIGTKFHHLHDFPSCQYDTFPQLKITQAIETDMRDINPDIVLTHFPGDSNTDHSKVFDSVRIATRALPNCPLEKVLLFEIPSSTTYGRLNQFKPDTYVEIQKDALSAKIHAMECYETEKAVYPHPRSPEALEALAKLRGTEIGVPYAEAFQTLWRKGL